MNADRFSPAHLGNDYREELFGTCCRRFDVDTIIVSKTPGTWTVRLAAERGIADGFSSAWVNWSWEEESMGRRRNGESLAGPVDALRQAGAPRCVGSSLFSNDLLLHHLRFLLGNRAVLREGAPPPTDPRRAGDLVGPAGFTACRGRHFETSAVQELSSMKAIASSRERSFPSWTSTPGISRNTASMKRLIDRSAR